MLLGDALSGRGEDMADKKDKKPGADNLSFVDSSELFEELFREELDSLAAGEGEKIAPKTDRKTKAVKRPRSRPQIKGDRIKKAGLEPGTKASKVVKKKPVSRVKFDTREKVAPQTNVKARKVVAKKPPSEVKADASKKVVRKTDATQRRMPEKKTASHVKFDARKKVASKIDPKISKIRRGRIGSRRITSMGSDKLKIALLSVILVVAVAFIINSLGIVDFGRLLGFSEPAKKERVKPRVAKKPPAKTVKKPTRVAAKPPQKATSPPASRKATSRKRPRVSKKNPTATVSKPRPLVIKKRPRVTSSTEKPVIAEKSAKPTTSTQKPLVVKRPSKPVTVAQKPPVAKKPPKPTTSTQKPVIAKKPPEPAPSKVRPQVVKAPPKPAVRPQKKAISATAELLPEERIFSYPYSVYLGSYQTRERAENAISGYRKKGLSPYWVKVHLGKKGVWFRVFTGYFRDKQTAEAFIKERQLRDAKAKNTKYSALIGVYATKEELNKRLLALSRLGYSAYTIDQTNGESLLFVGAFLTKIGAETQRTDLASRGIQSRVVER